LDRRKEYHTETRLAYRSKKRARAYRAQHTKDISWARFTMWRECSLVKAILARLHLTMTNRVIDIPCGTGVLGLTLRRFPCHVFAADIASEMMELARQDYSFHRFQDFVQADIINPPFGPQTFDCVIIIGLMHRLPKHVRNQALRGISSISNRFVVVSYSIDGPEQRIKHRLIKKLRPSHQSAPFPVALQDIVKELNCHGLVVKEKYRVVPFLSAEAIFLLEKNH
jgi:SAM-dependent methyltransferase